MKTEAYLMGNVALVHSPDSGLFDEDLVDDLGRDAVARAECVGLGHGLDVVEHCAAHAGALGLLALLAQEQLAPPGAPELLLAQHERHEVVV